MAVDEAGDHEAPIEVDDLCFGGDVEPRGLDHLDDARVIDHQGHVGGRWSARPVEDRRAAVDDRPHASLLRCRVCCAKVATWIRSSSWTVPTPPPHSTRPRCWPPYARH